MFNIGPIYTTLENVTKLVCSFYGLCWSRIAYPMIYGLVPSAPHFEIRQWLLFCLEDFSYIHSCLKRCIYNCNVSERTMPTKTHQGFQKDLSTVVILSDVVCCIRNPFLTQKYEASTNLLQAPVGCPDPYSLCFGNIFWVD